MYYQTVHHRPLVEGYSGFFPQTFRDLREVMKSFPDGESLSRLKLLGVDFCVVDRQSLTEDDLAALQQWSERLQLRYADLTRAVDVYELLPEK